MVYRCCILGAYESIRQRTEVGSVANAPMRDYHAYSLRHTARATGRERCAARRDRVYASLLERRV